MLKLDIPIETTNEETNHDWIREASEEELAELIYDIFDYAHNGSFAEYPTKYGIKEWLRQPKEKQ